MKRRDSKRTFLELRAARKEVGLTIVKAAALAKIPVSTWEKWEFSPDARNGGYTPEYPFQFLRCYGILKKHNLLNEFEGIEE